MSEDAVVDWESIIHKNVISKDGQDAGNVDAIKGDTVVVTSEGDRQTGTIYQNRKSKDTMVQKSL